MKRELVNNRSEPVSGHQPSDSQEVSSLRHQITKLKRQLAEKNEKINRWLSMAEKNGGYLRFFRLYTKVFNKQEALFVQDMMNRSEMVRDRTEEHKVTKPGKRKHQMDERGFFKCTARFMTNPKFMTWSRNEQERMFAKMESQGLISREKRGRDRERWIRVEFDKIYEMFDQALVILRREYRDWLNREGDYKPPTKSA